MEKKKQNIAGLSLDMIIRIGEGDYKPKRSVADVDIEQIMHKTRIVITFGNCDADEYTDRIELYVLTDQLKKAIAASEQVLETMAQKRTDYRRAIHTNGKWLYERYPEPMQDLIGEVMALNEEYCLNNPGTIKADEIWDSGFSPNQIKFIERVADNRK